MIILATTIIARIPFPTFLCGGECFLVVGYAFEPLGFVVHGVWHALLVVAMFFIARNARWFVLAAPSIAWGQGIEFSQGVRSFQHPSNFYGLIDSAESIVVAILTALVLEFLIPRMRSVSAPVRKVS